MRKFTRNWIVRTSQHVFGVVYGSGGAYFAFHWMLCAYSIRIYDDVYSTAFINRVPKQTFESERSVWRTLRQYRWEQSPGDRFAQLSNCCVVETIATPIGKQATQHKCVACCLLRFQHLASIDASKRFHSSRSRQDFCASYWREARRTDLR